MKFKKTEFGVVIPIEIYNAKVLLYVGEDEKKMYTFLEKNGIDVKDMIRAHLDDHMERATAFCSYFFMSPLIWTKPSNIKDRDYLACVLSHEAFHATARILETVGMQHCRESEEAYSYLQQYIMSKALTYI
jgi:hypothetical protein